MSRSWTSFLLVCKKDHARKRPARRLIALAISLCLLASCGQGSTPSGTPPPPGDETLKPLTTPPNGSDRPPDIGMTGAPKTSDGLPALQPPRGINAKPLFADPVEDTDTRFERLENAVQELRSDFDSMSPAIVRLVSVEKDIQNLIDQLQTVVNDPAAPVTSEELSTPYPAEETAPAETIPAAPIADDADAILNEPVENIIQDAADALPENDTISPMPETAPPPASAPDETQRLLNAPVSSDTPATADQVIAPSSTANSAPLPLGPAATEPVTPPPAPAPVPAAKAPVSKPVAPVTDGLRVTDIRFGEHPGKTRIVLDVSAATSFTADLDNNEHILVIEMPDAGWAAALNKIPAAHKLIASYKTQALGDKGTLLILSLKKDSSLLYKGTMKSADGKGIRIILDLAL
jgi:hypothetical protein